MPPPTIRRQIFLDHGRVQIDLPRLMTDDQLAEVLEVFIRDVKGHGTKEPEGKPPEPPSTLPPNRRMAKRGSNERQRSVVAARIATLRHRG
jgi:hypothetical protein